jgi:hypothetical protein
VFWKKARHKGEWFAAITDRATPLETLARDRKFRKTFLAPADVGGRYSALSVFGLVPAALAGVELDSLLDGGAAMARHCGPDVEAARNPGLFLGALLGAAAQEGRRIPCRSREPAVLGWVEQLRPSPAAKGKGLTPVVGEPAWLRRYGSDRLIVYLRSQGTLDPKVERWVKAGIPVAVVSMGPNAHGLGAEFLRWEVATAVACHRLGVNAFDQPDVQRAKDAARLALGAQPTVGEKEVRRPWELRGPADDSAATDDGMMEGMTSILSKLQAGDSFVLLAYLPQTPTTERALGRIRRQVHDLLKCNASRPARAATRQDSWLRRSRRIVLLIHALQHGCPVRAAIHARRAHASASDGDFGDEGDRPASAMLLWIAAPAPEARPICRTAARRPNHTSKRDRRMDPRRRRSNQHRRPRDLAGERAHLQCLPEKCGSTCCARLGSSALWNAFYPFAHSGVSLEPGRVAALVGFSRRARREDHLVPCFKGLHDGRPLAVLLVRRMLPGAGPPQIDLLLVGRRHVMVRPRSIAYPDVAVATTLAGVPNCTGDPTCRYWETGRHRSTGLDFGMQLSEIRRTATCATCSWLSTVAR